MYISRVRRAKSEGSVCNIRMLISYDDRTLLANQDLEYILLSNFSHSLGNPTPSGYNQTPHYESRKVLCSKRNFLGTMMRQKSSAGQSNQNSFLNQNHRHSVHKMEEFSGRIPLKTHHTGLLLSLPPNYGNSQPPKSSKTVHFLVGKQEDYEIPPLPVRRSKRSRLFPRHSVSGTASKINLNEATPKTTEEEDIVMEFPLRRSVSLDPLSERRGKCMDIVFQHTESHVLDSGKKTLGKRMKRVKRGLNLTDMHWISRKHSASSGISLKSTGSYHATQAGEVPLVSLSLRIQTDVSFLMKLLPISS
ncbi:unnamed protein product [Hymenolepis diminuta]|uniref:Si:ch73-389k6.1 n=1 Tax=Hymenolepis diminuta TaxID=6216 RepID=A0A0R3SJI9_HYMDI|nr:unnamed protein product [Hymenolepis diminuta]